MSLAPSALVQLDSACDLFAKTAPGFRAEKVFVSGNVFDVSSVSVAEA